MAGGGLRGLDFIEELTLIIVSCMKRRSYHSLCNLYAIYIYTHTYKSLLKESDIITYFLETELF